MSEVGGNVERRDIRASALQTRRETLQRSPLIAPQREASVGEKGLSRYISVGFEKKSHRARNVFRAAKPRNRAT